MADIGSFAVGSASTERVAASELVAVPLPAVVGTVALGWDGATAVGPEATSTVVGAPV